MVASRGHHHLPGPGICAPKAQPSHAGLAGKLLWGRRAARGSQELQGQYPSPCVLPAPLTSSLLFLTPPSARQRKKRRGTQRCNFCPEPLARERGREPSHQQNS